MTKSKEFLLSSARAMITKLNNFKEFLDSTFDIALDKALFTKIQMHTDSITGLHDKYSELKIQLDAVAVEAEDVIDANEFHNLYIDLFSQATIVLSDNMYKFSSTTFPQAIKEDSVSSKTDNINAKLPEICLPIYDGSFTNFTSYYESFEALIHNNKTLTNVEKFMYLQGSLKGVAAQTISDLIPSSENYEIALDLIRERFENPKVIILNHIKELFELKPITKRNASDFRKLFDNLTKHTRALKKLSIPIEECSSFIYYIIMSKLDHKTKSRFTEFAPRSIPTLTQINNFLSQHCQTLEEIDSSTKGLASTSSTNSKPFLKLKTNNYNSIQQSLVTTAGKISCHICNAEHRITECPQFLSQSINEKIETVNKLNICRNCLRHSNQNRCYSKFSCRVCHKRHHTSLHVDRVAASSSSPAAVNTSEQVVTNQIEQSQPSVSVSYFNNVSTQVLLSTAVVNVQDRSKKWHKARVLLDSGSHCNLITERLAEELQIERQPFKTQILGINSCSSSSNFTVNVLLSSLQNNFQMNMQCLTIKKIAEGIPLYSFEKSVINIPANIRLADNDFNKSSSIDMLIGASHFYKLMCIGQISLGKSQPTLQKTLLGWVVSGMCPSKQKTQNTVSANLVTNDTLNNSIQQLWKLDEIIPQNSLSKLSKEERFCEEHFIRTVSRNETGRFVVSIPFRDNLSKLGQSREQAVERFIKLERKLIKSPELGREYHNFINEYIALNHMLKTNYPCTDLHDNYSIETLSATILPSEIPPFYLPHHAVFKSNSLTTKLRVVFDGSAKSSSNISINDTQLVGPVLQNDLFSILLRFRQHKIVLTGDIEKMYRQILVHPSLRKFQRILWRANSNSHIDTYELQTITYGTASASYLATKCLEYLATLSYEQFPRTSVVLKSDFYMDDLLTGANSIEEVLQIKSEITSILSSAGFPIRKFLSNDINVISSKHESDQTFHTMPIGERENAKTLGITWNALQDVIRYNVSIVHKSQINSKRVILSILSQIFDPLGLVAPIVIVGKLIIQELWQLKLSWDEEISGSLNSQWNLFREELPLLRQLKIPRCVISCSVKSIQLHGFSDSSSRAFGCCIYIRTINDDNTISVRLLCSKSRVAPLKATTIPRLELCAAVLLAQLIEKVKQTLTLKFDKLYLWTDSTIVLHWLNSVPNKYKVFVSNRIAAVQEIVSPNYWYHVPSQYNPADIISRGTSVNNLLINSLWWHGPSFLSFHEEQWPPQSLFHSKENDDLEEKLCTPSFLLLPASIIFNKFSKLSKLKRVIAWMLRFTKNCSLPRNLRYYGPLKTTELQISLNTLIKLCQGEQFSNEINSLRTQQNLRPDSRLLPLNPFLDRKGILRVGGRIKNSDFCFDKKFPILLPKEHPLTKLLFEYYHLKLLHCGAQQLLATLRETYWPISGRSTAKRIIRNCIICFKANPKSYTPLMADLPTKRLKSGFPAFTHVGVDYAGPIQIKDRKLRGSRLIKSYVAVFVCLVTKAMHLELLTSLTSDAFISILKRFIGRRGKPSSILSDNAKNFVGAASEIKNLYQCLQNETFSNFISNESIKWEFITPRTPHQGGLWESGVKSIKTHLKTVLGNTSLNYEDFSTLLIQIEATLNSRPLTPLSDHPNDLTPLTPFHFLIGRSITALPEDDFQDLKSTRLSLYQRMQQILQCFWRRWSKEYVPELQRRTKWFRHLPNLIKINSLVIVKEDNLPPLQWMVGRVVEFTKSKDDVIRLVTVRMPNGSTLKRSVHKLCILPVE